jgi:hypothetical protein
MLRRFAGIDRKQKQEIETGEFAMANVIITPAKFEEMFGTLDAYATTLANASANDLAAAIHEAVVVYEAANPEPSGEVATQHAEGMDHLRAVMMPMLKLLTTAAMAYGLTNTMAVAIGSANHLRRKQRLTPRDAASLAAEFDATAVLMEKLASRLQAAALA